MVALAGDLLQEVRQPGDLSGKLLCSAAYPVTMYQEQLPVAAQPYVCMSAVPTFAPEKPSAKSMTSAMRLKSGIIMEICTPPLV